MNSKKLFVLIFVALILSVSLTAVLYSFYVIEDKKVIPMDIKVRDRGGFNLDTDAMHFGIAQPGGSAERSLKAWHDSDHALRVEIKTYGEMKDWVSADQDDFWLQPGEIREIFFKVRIPGGTPYGNYTGSIVLFFKRI